MTDVPRSCQQEKQTPWKGGEPQTKKLWRKFHRGPNMGAPDFGALRLLRQQKTIGSGLDMRMSTVLQHREQARMAGLMFRKCFGAPYMFSTLLVGKIHENPPKSWWQNSGACPNVGNIHKPVFSEASSSLSHCRALSFPNPVLLCLCQ